MRRLATLILSMMLTASAFLAIAAPTLGATQGACPGDSTRLAIYENAIGDTGDGNDVLWKCGSDSNLNNDDHTIPGSCNTLNGNPTSWNDCASSISIYLSAGTRLCIFEDGGYNGQYRYWTGPLSAYRLDLSGSTFHNDALSSLWIGPSSQNCAAL